MSNGSVSGFLREQVVFLLISFLCFATEPAVLAAQEGGRDPHLFSAPLSLSRGALSPGSDEGWSLTRDEFCPIMVQDWGWETCDDSEAMVVGFNHRIDTLVIDRPNSEGFVRFEDWRTDEREKAIADIEDFIRESVKAQGEQLGQRLEFAGWRVVPTLNEQRHTLYYAYDLDWAGETVTNIKAVMFDRRGYVTFTMIPFAIAPGEADVAGIIDDVLSHYAPAPAHDYAAFVTGDPVATAGAVGVLATIAGVKYGKAAVTGFLTLAIVILKKAWFLILMPFVWLRRRFGRKDG